MNEFDTCFLYLLPVVSTLWLRAFLNIRGACCDRINEEFGSSTWELDPKSSLRRSVGDGGVTQVTTLANE